MVNIIGAGGIVSEASDYQVIQSFKTWLHTCNIQEGLQLLESFENLLFARAFTEGADYDKGDDDGE